MNNVRKPKTSQQPTAGYATAQWRNLPRQDRPCTGRTKTINCLQLVRQKWLITGKTRWCDYA